MATYKIIDIEKSMDYGTCGHCGKAIKNLVTMEDCETGDAFVVGTECARKLVENFDVTSKEIASSKKMELRRKMREQWAREREIDRIMGGY